MKIAAVYSANICMKGLILSYSLFPQYASDYSSDAIISVQD